MNGNPLPGSPRVESEAALSTDRPLSTPDRKLLAGLALVVALLAVYQQRQSDPDLWGHLRYGQFFAEHGPGEAEDPFAYTSGGLTWHAHEWLAQFLLWQAYDYGGALGLIILKCLVGGGAIYFLYRAIRLASGDARIWAPVVMLGVGMVGRWFLFRPQLFTFCFFAYFAFVLLAHLLRRPARLWTLPPLIALWANLHGGFLAGVGAVGLALGLRAAQALTPSRNVWAEIRPLGLTLAACTLATLLTPFGLELWRYVLLEMTHNTNRLYIDEWMPLLRFDPHAWTILTVFLLLGLMLFVGVLAQVRPRCVAGAPAWLWLLSCLPLAWMAFASIRHVPMLALWAIPVLALLAQAVADSWAKARTWQAGWLAAGGLIGIPTVLSVYFTLTDLRVLKEVPPPVARAALFLKENNLGGNVYAPLEWGSYLTWELYPRVRVAMDGRNVTLFPASQVRESLTYFLLDGQDSGVPLRYRTDFLLVPAGAPVMKALRRDQRWQELYADDMAVLAVRADSAHADLLRRYRAGWLNWPPLAAPASFR
jgi:hypothetical protein